MVAGKDGGAGGGGGDFFQEELQKTKDKLKCEMLNENKRLYTRMLCSVVTKNSYWAILTKNLVTFKR